MTDRGSARDVTFYGKVGAEPLRISEIAKELNKPTKEIIEFLRERGVEAKSHMSNLEESQEKMVRNMFSDKPAAEGQERSKKKKNIIQVFRPQNAASQQAKNFKKNRPDDRKNRGGQENKSEDGKVQAQGRSDERKRSQGNQGNAGTSQRQENRRSDDRRRNSGEEGRKRSDDNRRRPDDRRQGGARPEGAKRFEDGSGARKNDGRRFDDRRNQGGRDKDDDSRRNDRRPGEGRRNDSRRKRMARGRARPMKIR